MQQQEALLSAHDVSAPAVLRDKEQEEEAPSKMFDGMKRIKDKFINLTLVNSDRRQYGVGVVGVWLDRDYRKSRIDSHVRQQMEELDDYRLRLEAFHRANVAVMVSSKPIEIHASFLLLRFVLCRFL